MEFDINDIATIGSVNAQDVPAYMLPPEAWTLALNMRYTDDGLESLDGWQQVFGTPLYAPHFAMSLATQTAIFWLYTSLSKAAVWDGVTHTDITRAAGDYTATTTAEWNGTILGGIPILNNGIDVPQFWAPQTVATKLANLTNWPAANRAKVIRAFGPYLIAFNLLESSVSFPHRTHWSAPAVPGAVPPSWDVADPTSGSGNVDLADVVSGVIVDALPLGSIMYVYKESSIWRMRFVGGQSKFDFGQSSWITTAGLLGPRCVCITGDGTKHVLATQDDIIFHNGNTVASILNKRQRKRLQNELDVNSFGNSFIAANPFNNEVWFCYPSDGHEQPDKALILNYHTAGGESWTVTEADGITFRNMAVGNLEAFTPEIWDTGSDTWEIDTGPWSRLERRRVVMCNPDASKFLALGHSQTRDGAIITSTLRREGLALTGKKRDGSLIVDFSRWKMLKRLWPKVRNGPVDLRFISQEFVDGAMRFGLSVPYNPVTQVFADPGIVSGRAVGFELTATVPWRIDGYIIDMVPMGKF